MTDFNIKPPQPTTEQIIELYSAAGQEWIAANTSENLHFYVIRAAIAWATPIVADAELEACCEWIKRYPWKGEPTDQRLIDALRDARRPKPASLKEQALAALYPDSPCFTDNGSRILSPAEQNLDLPRPRIHPRRTHHPMTINSRCWQLTANTSDGPIAALGWSTGLGPVRALFALQMGIRFQDVRARRRPDFDGTQHRGTISILSTTAS